MKNVTIALDDDTHRKARIRAAELGTSLSALVKHYLNGLAEGPVPTAVPTAVPTVIPAATGVREMPVAFKHAEPADTGPWLIEGKWSYTRDGKPRQPGALRDKLAGLPDDWDEWSPEMLEFFDKLQNEPWDDEKFDSLP